MIEKKFDKMKNEQKPRDDGVELENQFILRMPVEPANTLREAIHSGNLKERMSIKLDNDLRYGEVRLDHWLLYAKVLDLPTIIECLKTIDHKSFYKTADICQIMICKTEPDDEPEKESPNKGKKKDPNKVDKKYLWPHGITPPCKNVRKRRFRKTLKKKNVEAPEIEKEVKHLLRIDNEAVKVDYEIINEELDKSAMDQSEIKEYNDGDEDFNNETNKSGENAINENSSQRNINVESDDEEAPSYANTNEQIINNLDEHDIFGEELSSSEDEDNERNGTRQRHELEEASRLSADDSRISVGQFLSMRDNTGSGNKNEPTEFNKSMFSSEAGGSPKSKFGGSSSNLAAPSGFFDSQSQSNMKRDEFDDEYTNDTQPQINQTQIAAKVAQLKQQISELKAKQAQKSQEIDSIQNATLKQRMQESLDNILTQLMEKELELKDYENMLE